MNENTVVQNHLRVIYELVLHLDETCKVFSIDVVVCFQENLPQFAGSHRVVLGVELVKPVKCLSSLEENNS